MIKAAFRLLGFTNKNADPHKFPLKDLRPKVIMKTF